MRKLGIARGSIAAVAAVALAVGGLTLVGSASAEAATAGCGKAPTLTSGTKTIQSGGQNRSYILRIPDGYDRNKPYKLIFGFHWLNGTAANVQQNGFYGQQKLSNNTAILIAPQGIDNGWANTNGRDLTLVDNLLTLLQNDLCIDTSQIFATGWSYGGSMSYAVACARPNVFRAVAPLSGANLSGCNPGTQPVAYLGIHGIHDSVLNITMGRAIRDTFVRNNGCAATNPQEPTRGSLRHIVTNYTGCKAGYPVTWIAFDGDHTPEPVDGSTGTSAANTWTWGEIWKFFSALPSTSTPA
jgi:poly(3-hydroxybutyrate) depolymerase